MSVTIDKEKSMEILLERLIIMIGKSNERAEHLHNRVQHLEYALQQESPTKKPFLKTTL